MIPQLKQAQTCLLCFPRSRVFTRSVKVKRTKTDKSGCPAVLFVLLLMLAAITKAAAPTEAWQKLAPYFSPPPEYAGKIGPYRSPLLFDDGSEVKTAADWPRRRAEILAKWETVMGKWPAIIDRPRLEILKETPREMFTQYSVSVQVSEKQMLAGYLLVPKGAGPFPAVVVPFYDPETSIGMNEEHGAFRDYGLQLARRGFVTLSIGSPGGDARLPDRAGVVCQPLSYLGYIAANCANALANLPDVDPKRIGIVGHSYGGKWAMFGSCLYEKFAAAVWSDPGIVLDEARPNINYWEPWYLGFDPELKVQRKPGIINADRPRTGAYKVMIEKGMDLHELHALMAPRPFLVSGGAEDGPARWLALNHAVAVNKLLGFEGRVGMTNRKEHSPDAAANEAVYLFFEHFLKWK
jgi:dienelactone hydrolase